MMAEETPAQGPEIVLNASLAAKRAATAALKAKTAEPPVSEAPKPNGAAPATATSPSPGRQRIRSSASASVGFQQASGRSLAA